MMQGWARRENRRAIQYRRRSRTVVTTLQESYLRDDVPCGCLACPACAPTSPALAADAPFYVIPDGPTLRDCLDLFEISNLTDNVVLLASVVRGLAGDRRMGLRRAVRVRALYRDRRRRCILFDNLHREATAPGSVAEVRAGGDIMAAADWYSQHLLRAAGIHPTVLVVSDTLAAALGAGDGAMTPGELTPGVHVMSQRQYFAGRWGAVPEIADVFDSLEASRAEHEGGGAAAAAAHSRRHWSEATVAQGLSDGSLLRCSLSVNSRDPTQAVAVPSGATDAAGSGATGLRGVRIVGQAARARSLHGDVVAVRLLPKEEALQSLKSLEMSDEGAEEEESGDGGSGGAITEVEAATDMDMSFISGAADDVAEAAVTGTGEEDLHRAAAAAAAGGGGAAAATADDLPQGEVVAVLARSAQEVVCCISEADEKALGALAGRDAGAGVALSVLCLPNDRRLPRLRVRSRQLRSLVGQRLVVRVDGWEPGSKYPLAHVLRALGPLGDLRAETDAVLAASGVRWQPFGEPALRELPLQDGADGRWRLAPAAAAAELAAGRRDLRGDDYFIVSIDPPGCTDVDDAMHVRFLSSPNGTASDPHADLIEVGVHIADVSHFVPEGSALDAEAAARCTTVYLVDRRLDMLPAAISEDAASLLEGRDRLAVSVLWTLRRTTKKCTTGAEESGNLEVESEGEQYEVVDTWYGRTLIRSRHQMEYSQAQDLLEGRNPASGRALPPGSMARLRPALGTLTSLAAHLRGRRLAAGAVELESAELRFQTGEKGAPTGVTVKSDIEMMRVVAELMILANTSVAQRIYTASPRAALLRRHAPPRAQGMDEVRALCAAAGTPLPPPDAEGANLGAALRAACAAAPPAMATLIRATATRAMAEAQYFNAGDPAATGLGGEGGGMGHFGLALSFYTHFTSPIRRYADVVVHRQLIAALQRDQATLSTPLPLPSPAEVAERAAVMNERHRAAKRAQKSCSDLYLLLLLAAQPTVERAVVVGLRPPSALRIFVPKYHTQAVVHLTDRQGGVRPPLQTSSDAGADAGAAAGLVVVYCENSEANGQQERMEIVEAATGAVLAVFRPMQRLWVEMGAEASRAHGPTLRLRLLAEEHPDAQRAAAEKRRRDAGTAGGKKPWAPAPYRPPGVFVQPGAYVGAQKQRHSEGRAAAAPRAMRPPPGFDAAVAGMAGMRIQTANLESMEPAKPQHIAVQVPLEEESLAAYGAADPAVRVLDAARRLLVDKGRRYGDRAAVLDPRSREAGRWAAKAAACRVEACRVRQLLKSMASGEEIMT